MSCHSLLNKILLPALTSGLLVLTQPAQGQSLDTAALASTLLQVVHVDPVNGADDTTCGTESAPCRSVQQGVNRVAPGGRVKLAQGTHRASSASAPAVLDITFGPSDSGKDFTVQGGFVPPNWASPVPNPSLTVLDGENQRRVVNFVSVPSVRITLSNLSIVRGFVNTPVAYTGEFIGGGVHCRNDHPRDSSKYVQLTLSQVIVMSNTVRGYGNKAAAGGGVGAYLRCWLVLRDVQFLQNKVIGGNPTDGTRGAHALGGGLFATAQSGVDGERLRFERNEAIAGSGGQGFLGNPWDRADALGGGATFQYNWVSLKFATFISNTARAGFGSQYGGFGTGGGVLFEFSDARLEDVEFLGNLALGGSSNNRGGEGHGGGILVVDSSVRLDRGFILSNQAIGGNANEAGHGGGGGIYVAQFNAPSSFHGENIVIAYNKAEAGQGINRWGGGGGIYVQNASAFLTHTTIASNTVLSTMLAPAAISQYSTGRLSLRHGIIAYHSTGQIAAVLAHEQGAVTAQNNLTWSNTPNTFGSWNGSMTHSGIIVGDPKFIGSDSLDIQADSPAIDKAVGSIASRDVLRKPRPIGTQPDLGAYEYLPPLPPRAYLPISLR